MPTTGIKKRIQNLNRKGKPAGVSNYIIMVVLNETPNVPLFFSSAKKAGEILGPGSESVVRKAVKNGRAVGRCRVFGIIAVYAGTGYTTSTEGVMAKIGQENEKM